MKARRNSNRIFSIDNAEWQNNNDLEMIAKAFITFYEGLLGTNKRDMEHVCSSLVRQDPIVSAIQRTQLEEQFNENELKKALWAIAGDKAPGPDGFDSQFFKDGWEVVGKDVVEVVLECF